MKNVKVNVLKEEVKKLLNSNNPLLEIEELNKRLDNSQKEEFCKVANEMDIPLYQCEKCHNILSNGYIVKVNDVSTYICSSECLEDVEGKVIPIDIDIAEIINILNDNSQISLLDILIRNRGNLSLLLYKINKYLSKKTFERISELFEEIGIETRICSHCNKLMTSGYLIYDDYACSESCLYSQMTQEEYEEGYESDECYYTEFTEVDNDGYLRGRLYASIITVDEREYKLELISDKFIFYIDELEDDENGCCIMYNIAGEVVSDNYFAYQGYLEDLIRGEKEPKYIKYMGENTKKHKDEILDGLID